MRKDRIETTITICSLHELSPRERLLCEAAYEVAKNAYAPYSQFNVGAAVLLANGQIITGSNQENALIHQDYVPNVWLFFMHHHTIRAFQLKCWL